MNKEIILDVSGNEVAMALFEDKRLVEFSKEKGSSLFNVGDIYLGRVRKIMPSLNAAFIDVGYSKDAFLHYQDMGPQFKTLSKFLRSVVGKKVKLNTFSQFPVEKDIDKYGKINDVLKNGHNILVQVTKEPISSKGPRLTSEISLPGRYMVLIPFGKKVSISQKIKEPAEKKRLRKTIEAIKPVNHGIIVRTAAENQSISDLNAEVNELIKKWEQVLNRLKNVKPPELISGDNDRTINFLRDIYDSSFSSIHVNNAEAAEILTSYISSIDPNNKGIVKLYKGSQSIFDHFNVTRQVKSSFGKTVSFKGSSYLIIEHTEAFHVIDVNSGNRNQASSDQETNAFEVNLAAVDEIARQIRLRDMGGIVVIDFIDMVKNDHRKAVYAKMREVMASDRSKHTILPLSKFCLMQITRQRVRPVEEVDNEEVCPSCHGSGEVQPTLALTDEIEIKLNYIVNDMHKKHIELVVHPFVGAYINKGFWKSVRKTWAKTYSCKLKVTEELSMPMLNYKFFDELDEEILI
ncbi:MAG: Rne/Rng family ribonuclease [Bacteroidales bacterium]